MNKIRIRRRKQTQLRAELFALNPKCYWCRKLTVFDIPPDGRLHHNHATVDHIITRVHAASIGEYRSRRNIVLACHQCNKARNNHEQKQRATWELPPVQSTAGASGVAGAASSTGAGAGASG